MTGKFRFAVLPMLALSLATSFCPQTFAAGQTPEQTVRELYAYYQKSDAEQTNPNKVLPRVLDSRVWRAYEKANLDADPFVDGQDFQITDLEIAEVEFVSAYTSQNKLALVDVKFRNFGQAKNIQFYLQRRHDGWRIFDLVDRQGNSLRAVLGLKTLRGARPKQRTGESPTHGSPIVMKAMNRDSHRFVAARIHPLFHKKILFYVPVGQTVSQVSRCISLERKMKSAFCEIVWRDQKGWVLSEKLQPIVHGNSAVFFNFR